MKTFLLTAFVLSQFFTGKVFAQGGAWVWMNGTNTFNSFGNYGVMGVPSSSNCPPATYQGVQWTDTSGNFWLFSGAMASLSDALWKFDPVANMWTWIKGDSGFDEPGVYGTLGVPAPGNHPGSRAFGICSWTDKNGDLWLFGGWGYDANDSLSLLNDIWRYNIATNEWTWMGGPDTVNQISVYGTLGQASPGNQPQSRTETNSCWTDNNNNLWFFGGSLIHRQGINDMWRYSVSSGEWTWMNGGPDSATAPQARWSYIHWNDEQGNFYIYAGVSGFSDTTYESDTSYDDVWKYNLAGNTWTLLSGGSFCDSPGVYDLYCTESSGIRPSARFENRSARISGCNGELSLLSFGGFDISGTEFFNDLWSFDLQTNEWKWVSGDSVNSAGNYGTKGVASPSNIPPGRGGPCFWTDKKSNLWVFGGWQTGGNFYNDVWKFIPDSTCLPLTSGVAPFAYAVSGFSLCKGDSATLTITSGSIISVSPAVKWIDSANAVVEPDSSTDYVVIGLGGCPVAPDTSGFNITVHSPTAIVTANDSAICPNDSVQICATPGFSSYLWNTGQTTACIYTKQAGNYYATVTDAHHCTAVSVHIEIILKPGPSISISIAHDTFTVYEDTVIQWYLNGVIIPGATGPVYVASQSGNYSVQVVSNMNGCTSISNIFYYATDMNNIEPDEVDIYPNPSLGIWQADVSNLLMGSRLQIYDSEGRLVYNSQIERRHFEINTCLAAGIYFLTIQSAQNRVVTKLVVE